VTHGDAAGSGGRPQLLHYARGVGTRQSQRLRGGAFGYGLSQNVRECYRFLVENYRPGDKLYFFGFSRGAYTARSTVGLVRNCGTRSARSGSRSTGCGSRSSTSTGAFTTRS
jgi:uncharacterized protein (DUF2235 family)